MFTATSALNSQSYDFPDIGRALHDARRRRYYLESVIFKLYEEHGKMGMNVGWKFMTRQRFYRNRNLLGQRLLYYVNA